jgi:HEPN domain-containing protein
MNRRELQEISKLRRREARVLLKANHSAGAYYLLGYSVECALKACIAKQTKRHDFPDKDLAKKTHVHNLEQLLKLAGLAQDLEKDARANKNLELNWAVVKDWKEISRYTAATSAAEAKDLYSACTARKNGILSWIRARW